MIKRILEICALAVRIFAGIIFLLNIPLALAFAILLWNDNFSIFTTAFYGFSIFIFFVYFLLKLGGAFYLAVFSWRNRSLWRNAMGLLLLGVLAVDAAVDVAMVWEVYSVQLSPSGFIG